MTKELIIAAYERDYGWISSINNDVKITVYRKGEVNLDSNEIYLENNVGRDVHTFFYHFVKNYENLSDYTFSSQDYPFHHVNNYVDLINGNQTDWDRCVIEKISNCWFFNTEFRAKLTCNQNGVPHHGGLAICEIWNQLFDSECPRNFVFTPAGHFCISKETVLERPLYFYEKVMTILETNSMAPWIIERLEPYIFNKNYKIL